MKMEVIKAFESINYIIENMRKQRIRISGKKVRQGIQVDWKRKN